MSSDCFIEKLYKACENKNIGMFQIKYSFTDSESFGVFEGEINKREYSKEQSFLLEICHEGKIGRFSITSPNEEDIDYIISKALENAVVIDDEDVNFFYNGEGDYHEICAYKPLKEIDNIDAEKFLKDAEKRAYANHLINKVISCNFGRDKGKSIICNSLGLKKSREFDEAFASIYLSAKKGDVVKTAGETIFFDKVEDFNVDMFVDKAVKKAVDKLDFTKNITENQYVVFNPRAFASLLPKIAGLVSAKAVHDKKTKWKDCLKQKVASDIVSIVDNPWLDGGFASKSYDSEGVPTFYKEIIKDGVLQMFLYNLKTAYKDGVNSTGNAAGSGIGVSNFYIKEGIISKDELLKQVNNAVLITNLNGLHAGFNMVSGDFSFGAEGFEVREGKIYKALEQFTVSGNVYQMMKDVKLIANDLEFYGSGFGSSTIAIEGLKISG